MIFRLAIIVGLLLSIRFANTQIIIYFQSSVFWSLFIIESQRPLNEIDLFINFERLYLMAKCLCILYKQIILQNWCYANFQCVFGGTAIAIVCIFTFCFSESVLYLQHACTRFFLYVQQILFGWKWNCLHFQYPRVYYLWCANTIAWP